MARKRRKKTDAGLVAVGIKPAKTPDYVVVELKHDCCVGFAKSGFGGPAAVEKTVAALNKALGACRVKSVGSHLGSTASQVKKRVTAAPSSMKKAVTAEFAHAGFVQIVPRSSKDAAAIAKRFDRLASVWKAHVETPPVPAGAPTGASRLLKNASTPF